ncbi:hypothetical protein A6V36_38130 [Paraburkholderia ginsengiterrae]|uniref:Uncharacterized protein n=1 Tax=Paraburkholderia ginsengiterrae TaxID=1462993 RepID=A0ABX2UWK5_9BURK|nr:hypothetical protein A6V36_38130 [Paraburkholderia ginsengiterrae]
MGRQTREEGAGGAKVQMGVGQDGAIGVSGGGEDQDVGVVRVVNNEGVGSVDGDRQGGEGG